LDIESELRESNGYRGLEFLREKLRQENRRSAGPFSHPLAIHGPLSRLSDQIRDVSRIAEAVMHSAEISSNQRSDELCNNLRRLLQTQQRWTERLENQIWRLESQTRLMRRLQQVLLQNSPATDQIWELCEQIARETQTIPDGLLLLPEPGHRIVTATQGINHLTATAIERARYSVFAAMTLAPETRGADIVAGVFRSWLTRPISGLLVTGSDEVSLGERASQKMAAMTGSSVDGSSAQLLEVTEDFADRIDRRSVAAAESIVPPDIREFFRVIWDDRAAEEVDQALAVELSAAFGIDRSDDCNADGEETDDRVILSHRLRWHQDRQQQADLDLDMKTRGGSSVAMHRTRRPHFLSSARQRQFNVISDDE
ncbi:MAG: hypothetical protein ACK58L_05655, partial [Planctomycetota bacterium]